MNTDASLWEFKVFCRSYFCDYHLQIIDLSDCTVSLADKLWYAFYPPQREAITERFEKLFHLRSRYYAELTPEERSGCNDKLSRLFLLTGKSAKESPLLKEAKEDERVSNILPLHHFTRAYIDYGDVTAEKLPDFLLAESAFEIPVLKEIHADIARISDADMHRLRHAGYNLFDVVKYLLVNRHADHDKDNPYYVPGLPRARAIENIVSSTIHWKQTGHPA